MRRSSRDDFTFSFPSGDMFDPSRYHGVACFSFPSSFTSPFQPRSKVGHLRGEALRLLRKGGTPEKTVPGTAPRLSSIERSIAFLH
jgi:hypothetical protein